MTEEPGDSQQPYTLAPMAVILDPRLSEGAKTAYVYLDWRQGDHHDCWPSLETIAADLHTSPDTARRWVHELEAAGYAIITADPGSSNHYALQGRIERRKGTPGNGATPGTAASPPPANLPPPPLAELPPPPLANLQHESDSVEPDPTESETAEAEEAVPPAAKGNLDTQKKPENGVLLPGSPEAEEFFDRIVANLAELGLPLTEKKWGSLEQAKGFEWACEILEDEFGQVLDRLLRKKKFDYGEAVDYLMGAARIRAEKLHRQVTAPIPGLRGSEPIDFEEQKRLFPDLYGAGAREAGQ